MGRKSHLLDRLNGYNPSVAENRVPSERAKRTVSTVFYPLIEYRYEVAGRSWTGNRVKIGGGVESQDSTLAKDVMERYAPGSSVIVYHRPGDESLSVLDPDVSDGAVGQSIIGGTFSLVFGGLLAFVLSRHGREVIDALANPQPRDEMDDADEKEENEEETP